MSWIALFRPKVKCRYCEQSSTVKMHGKVRTGYQRYRCTACQKTFQGKYIYMSYHMDSKTRGGVGD